MTKMPPTNQTEKQKHHTDEVDGCFHQFKNTMQFLVKLFDEIPDEHIAEAADLFINVYKIITEHIKKRRQTHQQKVIENTSEEKSQNSKSQTFNENQENLSYKESYENNLNPFEKNDKTLKSSSHELLTGRNNPVSSDLKCWIKKENEANSCQLENGCRSQKSTETKIIKEVSTSELLTAANNLLSLSPFVQPQHEDDDDDDDDDDYDDDFDDIGNYVHVAIQQDDGTVQKIKYEVIDPPQQDTNDESNKLMSTDAANINNNRTKSKVTALLMQTRSSRKPDKIIIKKENDTTICVGEPVTPAKRRRGKAGRPKTGTIPPPVVNEKGENVYKCEVCNATVKKYHALLVHMRTHSGDRPFQCELCHKGFTTKGNMVAHLTNTHSTNKPWKCDTCGKYFKEKKVLKIHERVHTGERPFRCSVCNQSFTQSCALKEHMLIHTGKKPHLCDICGHEFRTISNMKLHKLRHLNQKNYKCEMCDKAFVSNGALQKHMISHTGERNFACDICKKQFAYLSSLKQHCLTHHTVNKEYVCEHCGVTFHEAVLYTQHKAEHDHQVSMTTPAQQTGISFLVNQSADTETIYLAADDKFLEAPIGKQTTSGEQMSVHVLVNDGTTIESEDYENLHSLLISAAMNADMTLDNQTTNKQMYQVMCVNPDTQEVVGEGHIEGQEVIVQGHNSGDFIITEDGTVGTIIQKQ